MKKKNLDHMLFNSKEWRLECRNCGTIQDLPKLVSFRVMDAYNKDFLNIHKKCKPQEVR